MEQTKLLAPRIEVIAETKLIGMHMTMSFSQNRTTDLWRSFMPRRNEISAKVQNELYALQLYGPHYFDPFNPDTPFEKWAAIAVERVDIIPTGMDSLIIPPGLYAVFMYKGLPSKGSAMFQYIFGNWLPSSDYALDDRPHFELIGEKYKNEHSDSEEQVWIPIRPN